MRTPKGAGIEGLPEFQFRDPANEGKLKRHKRYADIDFITRAITIATGRNYINVLFSILKVAPNVALAPFCNRTKYWNLYSNNNKFHMKLLKKLGWRHIKQKMPMSSASLPRTLTIVEQNDNMCVIINNVCYDIADKRHKDCVGYFIKDE